MVLVGCKEEEKPKTDTNEGAWPNTIYTFPMEAERVLNKQTEPGKVLSPQELQKYDLELPGTTNYQNSDQYSIFKGHQGLYRLSISRYEVPIQSSAHGEALFTLSNSVSGFGTDQPDLLWVIKDLNDDACDFLNYERSKAGLDISKLSQKPNLTSFPQIDVSDSIVLIDSDGAKTGCIKNGERNYYFYVVYPM